MGNIQEVNYIGMKENILWITALFLSIASIVISAKIGWVLFFWILKYLITNNARRIRLTKSRLITITRRSIYWVPLILPITFYSFANNNLIVYRFWGAIPIVVILGIIMQLPNIKLWKIVLSFEYISYEKKHWPFFYFMEVYSSITAAISEEVFFRWFVLSMLREGCFWQAKSVAFRKNFCIAPWFTVLTVNG